MLECDRSHWGEDYITDRFFINNPSDSSDPRFDSSSDEGQMNYGACPVVSPVGGNCLCHNVTDDERADGGLVGGNNRWCLDEINAVNGEEVFLTWYQRFVNRENVSQSTKFYGLSSKLTAGFPSFANSGEPTTTSWNTNYQGIVGGQGGGGAGWYHGGGGVNGLGKAWSIRLLHAGGSGSGSTNFGLVGAEVYHTDSTNLLMQNGATRQFGEFINPVTTGTQNPPIVGSGRINDSAWYKFCLRVKLNSLSNNPSNSINRDGSFTLWVNNTMTINRGNMHFTEDPVYRDWRFWGLIFGGGSAANDEPWQSYSDGVSYSETNCN